MKIYTGTGDDGRTGLLGGGRIEKASLRIDAIGEVDELNAALGVARAAGTPPEVDKVLAGLQRDLFGLGAELAAPPGGKFDAASLTPAHVEALERSIDALMGALPPLRVFILPGGSPAGAALHLARTVCRRAERAVLALHAHEPVRADARRFLNRVSDWLFAAARTANAHANVEDIEWHAAE